ncbi:MAG: hypothetical protein A3C93_05810 [Candidatus Lloydbacteria bacterium RIFCSPHIGHO2_02_FULL_54_17]|uniref:Uncharacterized protein n=1 Tax=Candidatus Lloydbacteria bacterium RIFCSPHIGHO2_02_FULL_54_17 TaxID=1798664 RepID=A0A1G2DGL6_9BACT|nr:MAG: hypothetical protein A2762_02760 [Candidatus Lloydbacteria bacterium RIFCSPHIGHO2_01_FULL_54_11]OGZ11928.1 MAG: hypothetical protein A3C93_05810 [Candidatus Lloydbacteria bacterium RIFCSPHIGHO2_02_FULL_54_17]OGZ14183.1 MAG: hypothetical protein A2948_02500 [Candidatus Lloydbacteria bacterium RIFCSPLOWO2_01_FULL_54_18]OGZ15073.1 MAG: hypothetical protein A3H76_06630 [Candidatus Lloydbacteria bacterium RIFCSPLOWO2_02_FULL_54_12]
MEAPQASKVAEDVAIFLEELECHRDQQGELRALFYAALRFAIRRNAPHGVFDEIIKAAISHRSLQSSCLVVVEKSSEEVQWGLRQAVVSSGDTMDAIEIAAKMRIPLTREEIVLLGSHLGQSREPLSSARNLLGYAERQKLPELDLRRLRTQIAEVERAHVGNSSG